MGTKLFSVVLLLLAMDCNLFGQVNNGNGPADIIKARAEISKVIQARLNGMANIYNSVGNYVGKYGDYLGVYNNYLRARGSYMESKGRFFLLLAEANLKVAQAELARTANEKLKQDVVFWKLMNSEFRRQLNQLRKEEYKKRQRRARLGKIFKGAKLMSSNAKFSPEIFHAWKMLAHHSEFDINGPARDFKVPKLDKSEFLKQPKRGNRVGKLVDYPGGHFLNLMAFMNKNHLTFVYGSKSHDAADEVFRQITQTVVDEIRKIGLNMLMLRDATLNFWENMARVIRSSDGGANLVNQLLSL